MANSYPSLRRRFPENPSRQLLDPNSLNQGNKTEEGNYGCCSKMIQNVIKYLGSIVFTPPESNRELVGAFQKEDGSPPSNEGNNPDGLRTTRNDSDSERFGVLSRQQKLEELYAFSHLVADIFSIIDEAKKKNIRNLEQFNCFVKENYNDEHTQQLLSSLILEASEKGVSSLEFFKLFVFIKGIYVFSNKLEEGIYGIQNTNNSCTIASVLFSMLGATNYFDRFLLLGEPRLDGNGQPNLNALLRFIANRLRSPNRYVESRVLIDFRDLLNCGGESLLDPQEVIENLFKKLEISRDYYEFLEMGPLREDTLFFERLVEILITQESPEAKIPKIPEVETIDIRSYMELQERIRQMYLKARDNVDKKIENYDSLSKNEKDKLEKIYREYLQYNDCKDVKEFLERAKNYFDPLSKEKLKDTNQILFIQASRQNAAQIPYGGISHPSSTFFERIIPSLEIKVEGQEYRLQAVITHEAERCHYTSWVVPSNEENLYYFDSNGCSDSNGSCHPTIGPKKDVYDFLKSIEKRESKDNLYLRLGQNLKLNNDYLKLIKSAVFFIYVRK